MNGAKRAATLEEFEEAARKHFAWVAAKIRADVFKRIDEHFARRYGIVKDVWGAAAPASAAEPGRSAGKKRARRTKRKRGVCGKPGHAKYGGIVCAKCQSPRS